MVKDFILECPQYHQMVKRKLHHNTNSLPFLLKNPTAVLSPLKYIYATDWFKSHFWKNLKDRIFSNAWQNAELHCKAEEIDSFINNVANHIHNNTVYWPQISLSPLSSSFSLTFLIYHTNCCRLFWNFIALSLQTFHLNNIFWPFSGLLSSYLHTHSPPFHCKRQVTLSL